MYLFELIDMTLYSLAIAVCIGSIYLLIGMTLTMTIWTITNEEVYRSIYHSERTANAAKLNDYIGKSFDSSYDFVWVSSVMPEKCFVAACKQMKGLKWQTRINNVKN